jgi:pyruvate/2-oxoglutarate dehydrogenase complex dihydrolipoamide dehydrogenase (E3) component
MAQAITVLPSDTHNETLVSNVHPSDWQNPEPAPSYNLVVIGAGTAGLVSAAAAAGLGAKVALVERHLMGGDCLNVGCVPSKAIIRSARARADILKAEAFGVATGAGSPVDFGRVMERLRRLRAGISHHDSAHRFSDLGIDVFLGEGQFKDSRSIQVDGKLLRFKKAVIATGARATSPPIPGLEESGFLTNETVFSLTELPKRLLVLGGGPIGCELAQAFSRLGAEVTLVEMGSQFLPREDADAAEILAQKMEADGVDIRLATTLTRVSQENHEKHAHLSTGDVTEIIPVDEILVGVGRVPNVKGLNLEAAGVEYDRRQGVKINDRLQTTNPRIFAAGDVALDYKFTHTADATARIVIQNALFMGRKKVSSLTVPWCTYTSPEIAHVGIYEKDAQTNGIEVTTYKIPFSEVDRAILDGEEEGFLKIHVKKGTDRILGATIVAEHAGDMISELTLAIVAGVGLGSISSVIHPYPTQAEAIRKAADAYNRTRLTPFVKRMFEKWFSWLR